VSRYGIGSDLDLYVSGVSDVSGLSLERFAFTNGYASKAEPLKIRLLKDRQASERIRIVDADIIDAKSKSDGKLFVYVLYYFKGDEPPLYWPFEIYTVSALVHRDRDHR